MVLNRSRPRKALIAGTGSIGRRHIASLRELQPDMAFALLRDRGRVDDYSREIGATVFPDLDAAKSWKPDLAVIATPSDRHCEVVAPLLDAGIAVFVEKPVVIQADEAERLLQRESGRDPPSQVGCVLRFLGAVQLLQSWLERGRLGRIARARFECGQYLPDWRPGRDYRLAYSADGQRGGGVVFDLVHEIDLAVALLGVSHLHHALLAKRSSLDLSCEDVALLHLSGDDGVPVSIDLDYVSRMPVRSLDIVGEIASARLDFIGRRLTLTGKDGLIDDVTDGFDYAGAYRLQFAELLDAIDGKAATRIPIKEGMRATCLAIAAHRMAEAGAPLR